MSIAPSFTPGFTPSVTPGFATSVDPQHPNPWPAEDRPFRADRFVVAPSGRLRDAEAEEKDRTVAIMLHLWWLAWFLPVGPFAIGLPVGLWLWRRDESPWIDDQGREVLNFAISQTILTIVLAITILGIVLLPVLWIVGVVGVVRGAMAASRREFFRYPLTFRLLTPARRDA